MTYKVKLAEAVYQDICLLDKKMKLHKNINIILISEGVFSILTA